MELDFISLLLKYDAWVRFFHVAGAIVSLGSVVAADIILVWLKFKPNEAATVAKITPLLSLQVWIGLSILALSGLLLFLPRAGIEEYSLFQLKMGLVLLVFINGIFLNVWVTPRFKKLVPEWSQNTERVRNFTKIAGVATALSFVGWWGIVILMKIFY
jgi:hypothetical protein